MHTDFRSGHAIVEFENEKSAHWIIDPEGRRISKIPTAGRKYLHERATLVPGYVLITGRQKWTAKVYGIESGEFVRELIGFEFNMLKTRSGETVFVGTERTSSGSFDAIFYNLEFEIIGRRDLIFDINRESDRAELFTQGYLPIWDSCKQYYWEQ